MILPNDSLILKTKIAQPVLKQQVVSRARLSRLLESGADVRLTVVSAPAGFGKTTLLAQWLQESGRLCAWTALDERDNDYVRFWRCIVYAFAAALPELQGVRLLQTARSLPGLSLSTFLDSLVNELFELPEITLVLDDLHFITDMDILDGLAYLIDYLPPQIHVLLSTRTDLPFPGIKWKARKELTEITLAELQFTLEESELFFQLVSADYPFLQHLKGPHIRRLTQQTEGWITGMLLMAMSLRSEGDLSRLLAEFNGNRDITDYLFHEVVSGLSGRQYAFLLKTSVLTRLDGPICEALTGETDGREFLRELLRLNLFLVPLDARNETFRYHHLFARFLQEQLRQTKGQAEWVRLHEQAALHFAAHDAMDEAVEHALSAGKYKLAEKNLIRHAASMLERGEVITVLNWLRSFPESYSFTAELDLFYAFVCVLTGQLIEAEQRLEELEQVHRKGMEPGSWRRFQSGLLFVRSNLVFMNGDFGRWFAFSDGILDQIVPDNSLYFGFDYNRSEPLVRRTALGLKGVLSADTEKIGLMFTGILGKHGWSDTLICLYVKQSLCEGYYEWNRLDECSRLLEQISRSSTCARTTGLSLPNRLMQVRLHMTGKRWEAARQVLDEAAEMSVIQYGEQWLPYIRAMGCRLALEQGKLAEAKKEMAHLNLTAKDKPAYNQEFLYLTLVRLLGKQRKEAEGLRLLELLKPQAQREQQVAVMVEIGMLQALLEFKRNRKQTAFDYVEEILPMAEQNGYIRLFADEGPDMLALLQAYEQILLNRFKDGALGDNRAYEAVSFPYLQKLIGSFACAADEPAIQYRSETQLIEPLNRSEAELLGLLRQGATNKEIAKALALSEGTVRVYLSRLYGKLQVTSRTQALIAAQELKLLDK